MPNPLSHRKLPPPGIIKNGLLAAYPLHDQISGTSGVPTDISGNGYHATMGLTGSFLPTWNSKGLGFSGNQLIQLPITFWGSVRTAQVFCSNAVTSKFNTLMGKDNGNSIDWIALRNSGQMCANGLHSPSTQSGFTAMGDNSFSITWGTDLQRFYINGVETPSYVEQSNGVPTAASSSVYIGYDQAFAYTGTMYYLLFYDRVLSSQELTYNHNVVGEILKARGVTLGNTRASSAVQVIAQGDSLTEGVNASVDQGWLYLAMNALTTPGYAWSNWGVGGQRLATIVTTSGAQADKLWASYSGTPRVYVLWAGTNDIINNDTAATIYNNIKTRCAAATAAGATKICLIDCINRGAANGTPANTFTTAQRVVQGAFNALLAADFSTNVTGLVYTGATYADFLYTASAEPNLSDPTNTTYYASDQIHLTNTGYTVIKGGGLTMLQQCGLS